MNIYLENIETQKINIQEPLGPQIHFPLILLTKYSVKKKIPRNNQTVSQSNINHTQSYIKQ